MLSNITIAIGGWVAGQLIHGHSHQLAGKVLQSVDRGLNSNLNHLIARTAAGALATGWAVGEFASDSPAFKMGLLAGSTGAAAFYIEGHITDVEEHCSNSERMKIEALADLVSFLVPGIYLPALAGSAMAILAANSDAAYRRTSFEMAPIAAIAAFAQLVGRN